MAYVPTKLPNSAIITLVPSISTSADGSYSLSCLNENGQVCDVILNIVEATEPTPYPENVSIFLPLISSLNFRNVKITINYSNLPIKVQVIGGVNEIGEQVNGINGQKSLPCVNTSGYQVFSVIGVSEWQSLAEITAYNRIIDGGSAIELPRRDTLEFQGANVSISDDALAQRTIVTINS